MTQESKIKIKNVSRKQELGRNLANMNTLVFTSNMHCYISMRNKSKFYIYIDERN